MVISIKSWPPDCNRLTEIVCLLNIITLLMYICTMYIYTSVFQHLDDVVKFSMSSIVLTHTHVCKISKSLCGTSVFLIIRVVNSCSLVPNGY